MLDSARHLIGILPPSLFSFSDEGARRVKLAFWSTMGIGLACHLFGFASLSPSHDYLFNLFYTHEEYIHQISLGRTFVPALIEATGSVASMPLANGLLGLLFLSSASALISHAFRLNATRSVALGIVLATNRTVTALTATYVPWLPAQCLASLLAVCAFWFWGESARGSLSRGGVCARLAAGAACLLIALGLYQASVSVTLVLISIRAIVWLLLGDRDSAGVLRDGLRGAAMVVAAGAAYYIAMRGVLAISGIGIADAYNSLANVWTNTEGAVSRLLNTYLQVWDLLFGRTVASAYPLVVARGYDVLVALGSALVIILAVRRSRPSWSGALIALALLVTLPMFANISRMLNSETHDLMYYAVWLLVLLPIVLIGKTPCREGLSNSAVLLLGAMLLLMNAQTANLCYQVKRLEYDATQSLMTEVFTRIDGISGYREGETPVIFLGDVRESLVALPESEKVRRITGMEQPVISAGYTAHSYVRYVLGRKANVQPADGDDVNALRSGRGAFPAGDAVWMQDGVVYALL